MLSSLAKTIVRPSICMKTSRNLMAGKGTTTCKCLGLVNNRLFTIAARSQSYEGNELFSQRNATASKRLGGIDRTWNRFVARGLSTSSEEPVEENVNDGNGLELNGVESKNGETPVETDSDAQFEKSRKEEQDFWLKMCSNPDPNDNTVKPDAFKNTDPWNAPDSNLPPLDDNSHEHDKN